MSGALGGIVALACANARYWPTVAPRCARELRRWELRARTIPDPQLRELALVKLRREGFNAQVAATLTTLAPSELRAPAVTAVVALEVLFDYLDGLTEQPAERPLQRALDLHGAFTDALVLSPPSAHDAHARAWSASRAGDGGYLEELSAATRAQLSDMPAWPRVATVARRAALRAAQAQSRLHAARPLDELQLARWARPLAQQAGLGWREFLAGAAASVLICHALIVCGAGPGPGAEEAESLDRFYLRVSALSTLLDALIDRDRDQGSDSLLRVYRQRDDLADALCSLVREACELSGELPQGSHHLMIMAGVVAYYVSAPQARAAFARPVTARLRRELSPLIFPTLAVMRSWRAAKRARALIATEGRAG